MRQKLLLVAAVFFGILAFVLSYQQINAEKAKINSVREEIVVIALNEDLSAREVIKEEHLTPKKTYRFKGDKANSYITWKERNNVIGCKVASAYTKGEILTWHAIDTSSEETGRTGLTAKIDNGKVAVAIPVDAVSSMNGLVRPNNRVNVIGTFTKPGGRGDTIELITMTLMQDIRVLACGSDMGYQNVGRSSSRSYGTMTLEVTPFQAKVLIFAQRKGRLSLILHPPAGTRETNLQQVEWSTITGLSSGANQRTNTDKK